MFLKNTQNVSQPLQKDWIRAEFAGVGFCIFSGLEAK